MTFTGVCRPPIARIAGGLAVTALIILVGGCAASGAAGVPGRQASQAGARSAAAAGPGGQLRALAGRYLAIAVPASHRLDTEVDGFTDRERDDLAAAESDLRAEAATERWFDQRLAKIPFPAGIAATAGALARANQRRAELTDRQARSASLTGLRSLASRHRAADAAVEVDVRLIRRALRLPPPAGS
jgi:hypothetical protein